MTFDLTRHLEPRLSLQMLDMFDSFLPTIAEASGRALREIEAAYAELRQARSTRGIAAQAQMRLSHPADVCRSASRTAASMLYSQQCSRARAQLRYRPDDEGEQADPPRKGLPSIVPTVVTTTPTSIAGSHPSTT